MMHKNSIGFLILLLLVICATTSIDAVPVSRSWDKFMDEQALRDLHAQEMVEWEEDSESLQFEGRIQGRMAMQTLDYPGPGANNHHDPKSPGGV